MAAHQAPPSLGFSRQEHRSGLPFPSLMHACMLSHFSRVQLYVTPWTAAHQAPLSLGFSRQEYWSGLPFPSPVHACMLSHFSRVQLFATPWTAACQAPLSTGFSRQEYWSWLSFPSPQYARKFGKLSSYQRTGKGQFSFKSQRKAVPKNVQTTSILHSFHMITK